MEVWKEYGSYEISNLGNVKGPRGKILKPFSNTWGYLRVIIYENGKRKSTRVHRLVAICFLENPENKPEVDHINRIKTDNRVENLRWATRSENIRNKGDYSNNKSGHKHIITDFMNGREYWKIQIRYLKIHKRFNKSKYTLEKVVQERNKIYQQYNINENN